MTEQRSRTVRSSTRLPRSTGVLAFLAVGLMIVLAGAVVAQSTPRPRGTPRASATPRPSASPRPSARPDPAGTPTSTVDANEEDRLRAMREKARGPQFVGEDPAFLVLPRKGERSQMVAELMTPKVREMIRKSLDYLAAKQEADGGYSDTQFTSNTGVTALACLAFMAEGSRPRVGKYGRAIDRGLEFLLKNRQSGGVIAGKGSNPLGPAYENCFSTLALIYAYGDCPHLPVVRDTISRSVQAIAHAQKLDGGWRYDFGREGQSDMSITANTLWVLRSAKKSGFTVAADSVSRGVEFVTKCAMPDGTFRYRTFGNHAEPSIGGTGVIALCNNGTLAHPLIGPARDAISYDYDRYTIEDLKNRRYIVFGIFYASLAQYMCGDQFNYKAKGGEVKPGGFIPWFKKATAVLAAMQRKDGEFWDEYDNTLYPTAMSVIMLQSPLGYLPIYER